MISTMNDTTNTLTTRIIFGNNRHPQLVYTDLATGKMYGAGNVELEQTTNAFPGYEFVNGNNMYRGENVGFGGYVYAVPGVHKNVALLDVASMHPHSIIAMNCFGEYTARFKDLVDARIAIKHKNYEEAGNMLGGALRPYLGDSSQAKSLSKALKIPINSVYGLTSASFQNPFRDPRNVNNIVALRGALFMVTLRDEVIKRGFTVAHIKTDSIKIPDATPEIIEFCMNFAREYGYEFEHEATYEKMCLVNDAVYIAKYASVTHCKALYGDEYVDMSGDILKDNKESEASGELWTATGTQFQIPFVFKTLFSHEAIEFEDMCETKTANSALYLDMNETLVNVEREEAERDALVKKIKDKNKKIDKIAKERSPEDPEIELLKNDISICEQRIPVLDEIIKTGHDYHFVGKAGLYCPIIPGAGGGLLMREQDGKFNSVVGCKGYRWLETENVIKLNKQDCIDITYYRALVDAAIDDISKHCENVGMTFEEFVA